MIYLILLSGIPVLWYLSLVHSFVNDRKNKKLSFDNYKVALLVTLTFPAFSIYIHLKGAYHCYKKKDFNTMKLFIKLGTYQIAVGISFLTEFITRVSISRDVYGMEMNGRKIKKEKDKEKQLNIDNKTFFNREIYTSYENYIPA